MGIEPYKLYIYRVYIIIPISKTCHECLYRRLQSSIDLFGARLRVLTEMMRQLLSWRAVLGTAAAALGTALVVANSPWIVYVCVCGGLGRGVKR